VQLPDATASATAVQMTELAELARTAGAEVVGSEVQRRGQPEPALFIGRGKVEELKSLKSEDAYDLLICNEDLSPRQQRNLERELRARVPDRTEVILEIFAQHARTREGRLQVESARLHHLLPRLIGAYAYDRQVGGSGAGWAPAGALASSRSRSSGAGSGSGSGTWSARSSRSVRSAGSSAAAAGARPGRRSPSSAIPTPASPRC